MQPTRYVVISHQWQKGFQVDELKESETVKVLWRRQPKFASSVLFKSNDGGKTWLTEKKYGVGAIDKILKNKEEYLPKPLTDLNSLANRIRPSLKQIEIARKSSSSKGFKPSHNQLTCRLSSSDDDNGLPALMIQEEDCPDINRNLCGYKLTTTGIVRTPHGISVAGSKLMKKICGKQMVKLEKLGRGASGTVTKVLHLPSLQFMAIKKIHGIDNSNRAQIKRELDTFRKLDTDYVVRFHGAYVENESFCLALEYMDCGTLNEFVDTHGRTLPEDFIRHFAFQLTQGLHYLKQSHMLHRDIKPENILVNHKGSVKIADFGLAKILINSLQRTDTYRGTKSFMAPERMECTGTYGYSAEVWSLGLCLVYCAIGRNPFDGCGEFDYDVMKKEYNVAEETNSKYSEEFYHFVSVCLQPNESNRYTVEQLIEHLFLTSTNPDLGGSDKWEKFCKISPCSDNEFYKIVDNVRENISQIQSYTKDEVVTKLAELTSKNQTTIKKEIYGKESEIEAHRCSQEKLESPTCLR